MERISIIENGTITSVQGFKAAGIVANIKGNNTWKRDLGLIYSDIDCTSAGVFTTNKVCSKTVDVSRENINKGDLRAIIVNSGNANACVGRKGLEDANKMVDLTAEVLEIPREKIAVSSTGVIGKPLPMDRIEKGIRDIKNHILDDGGMDFIDSIMTTDTTKKHIAVEIILRDGSKARIGGVCKGSGMIHPNMATMLGYITTDINISKDLLSKTLKKVTNKTFNMISVDRDTSTNDMVIAMANRLAGNDEITSMNTLDYDIFRRGLLVVMEYLAKNIAVDGEGATKLIEVNVKNAETFKDAKQIGMSVVSSPLVKTAIFGQDGNWGRIIAAIGYSGIDINEGSLNISINNILICENGIGILEDETELNKELEKDEIKIIVDIKEGNIDAKVWGCDLGYDYIKINADYRS